MWYLALRLLAGDIIVCYGHLFLLLLLDVVTLIIVQHETNMVDVIVIASDCILSCVIIRYPFLTPYNRILFD